MSIYIYIHIYIHIYGHVPFKLGSGNMNRVTQGYAGIPQTLYPRDSSPVIICPINLSPMASSVRVMLGYYIFVAGAGASTETATASVAALNDDRIMEILMNPVAAPSINMCTVVQICMYTIYQGTTAAGTAAVPAAVKQLDGNWLPRCILLCKKSW